MPVRFSLLALVIVSACGPSVAEDWARAEELWQARDPAAYDDWLLLDEATPEGRSAHERLIAADALYREGIRRLVAGEDGARDAIVEGRELAPIDPENYLSLARACRDQGLTGRAVEYYRKFIVARPEGPDADAARAELGEIDPSSVAEVLWSEPTVVVTAPGAGPSLVATSAISAVVGSFLTMAVGLLFLTRRRRGGPLNKLAASSPELHPAIAYLVGSLRHELLKHRVGAVGDAIQALGRGGATDAQLSFVEGRLFGGEPLMSSWKAHLASFERALGYRLDLRRDRQFRRAERAIARISALEGRIAKREASVERVLSQSYEVLQAFDRELAKLVHHLVRTRVDLALLEGVVADVRGEYAPGLVELDAVEVKGPDELVEVEVFRVDLVLILKNVIRNAVLAVGRTDAPRRISVDARSELEPTGEEIVFLTVRDTSTEELSRESIYDRRVDRGLGLVTAALTRYDGAIEVERAGQGYEKAVSIRFFRALDGEVE